VALDLTSRDTLDQTAVKHPRVAFQLCAIALRNHAVEKGQLLPADGAA